MCSWKTEVVQNGHLFLVGSDGRMDNTLYLKSNRLNILAPTTSLSFKHLLLLNEVNTAVLYGS